LRRLVRSVTWWFYDLVMTDSRAGSLRAGSLLAEWTDAQAQALGERHVHTRHSFADHYLFSDEGLMETFDAHPPDQLFVYTMGSDPTHPDDFTFGRRGSVSAAQLLDTVRRGHLWLNIIRVQDHHPAWRELVDSLYAELEARTPGLRTYAHNANLLVSSPTSMVYYHADAPLNMLWHARGRKEVFVYPPGERYAPREALEKIFAGQTEEELPYQASYDDAAVRYVLEPGDLLTWPQNIPHRVTNLEGLNVSLSTEHYTAAAQVKQEVYLSNLNLRRWFHLPTRDTRVTGPFATGKRVMWKAAKKVFKEPERVKRVPVFEVDPTQHDGVRWL
jgi:hypothetical protein